MEESTAALNAVLQVARVPVCTNVCVCVCLVSSMLGWVIGDQHMCACLSVCVRVYVCVYVCVCLVAVHARLASTKCIYSKRALTLSSLTRLTLRSLTSTKCMRLKRALTHTHTQDSNLSSLWGDLMLMLPMNSVSPLRLQSHTRAHTHTRTHTHIHTHGRPHEKLTPLPAKESHLTLRKHISAFTPPLRDLRHALDSYFFSLQQMLEGWGDVQRLGLGGFFTGATTYIHMHTRTLTHAQRAEANRLLKEVEKRLMIAKDLVPASPLIPSGSCRPPLPPANIEGRARLVDRRAQLEMQVRSRVNVCVCACVCLCM
jgi:hypothetical protein